MTDVTPQPTGTIDITDTVSAIQSSFVTYATAIVMGAEAATPGLEWLTTTPIIEDLDKLAIQKILTALSNDAVMAAFFLNTAIRKASQAHDFVDAYNAKKALPTTATDEEYANAEKAELLNFRNFVVLSN